MFDFLPHQILEIIRWKMEIFAEIAVRPIEGEKVATYKNSLL